MIPDPNQSFKEPEETRTDPEGKGEPSSGTSAETVKIPLEGGVRFLVAGAGPEDTLSVCSQLRAQGFEAEHSDGMEGLRIALDREFFDVVLLDLHASSPMEAEGPETVRTHPLGKNLPILVLSDDPSAGRVNRFLEMGVQGYMLRPLDIRKLLGRVSVLEPAIHFRRIELYVRFFVESFHDMDTPDEVKVTLARQLYRNRFFNDFLNNPSSLPLSEASQLYGILSGFFRDLDRMMLDRVDPRDEDRTLGTLRFLESILHIPPEREISGPLSRIIAGGTDRTASKAVKLLGKTSRDLLLLRRFVFNRNSRFVSNLLEALWESRHPECSDMFRSFRTDANPRVRANAAVGLHTQGHEGEAVDILRFMLQNELDTDMCRSALWACTYLGYIEPRRDPAPEDAQNLRRRADLALSLLPGEENS